jgi:hypothetical protein
MPTVDLQTLKERIKSIEPLLERNLATVGQMYNNNSAGVGLYLATLSRREYVRDFLRGEDLPILQAFQVGAMLTLDLRTALRNADATDVPGIQAQLDSWIEFYREAGFTEMHPQLNFPVPPHR